MNRRSFMARIAALPFVGSLLKGARAEEPFWSDDEAALGLPEPTVLDTMDTCLRDAEEAGRTPILFVLGADALKEWDEVAWGADIDHPCDAVHFADKDELRWHRGVPVEPAGAKVGQNAHHSEPVGPWRSGDCDIVYLEQPDPSLVHLHTVRRDPMHTLKYGEWANQWDVPE